MENVNLYRQKILEALLDAKTDSGEPKLTEDHAQALAQELSDEELIDGMDFNTPEEVAELLLESGL